MERLIIIDGNSLINRAYYAIQKPMITADGFYTQGIYGFLSMLFKIEKDYNPTHMLVAFDRKAPTFRHKEYAEYKAGRKKMPMELAMEMPVLKEILDAMGIARYEEDGWEADDILGTTAKMAEQAGLESFIITGDRDALQLATEKTKVLITKKGISEFKLYDDEAMKEEYGFDHIQFIDYKGLRGDTSDNIPGIAGIGEKTAVKLIQQFGSIENIIARSGEITSEKLRLKVEEGALDALTSKHLATIVTDVPVEFTIDDLKIKPQDRDKLISLYSGLEFKKYLAKLLGEDKTEKESSCEPALKEDSQIEEWAVSYNKEEFLRALNGTVYIEIKTDGSHTRRPAVFSLQIAKDGHCFIAEDPDEAFIKAAFDKKIINLAGFALQDLYYCFEELGIDTSGLSCVYDASLAQYVLNPGSRAPSLSEILFEAFHIALDNEASQIDMLSVRHTENCGKRFAYIDALRKLQERQIEEQGLGFVYKEIELPLCRVLASMEAKGIMLDKAALKDVGDGFEQAAGVLKEEIYKECGEEFNINSPKQLGVILFEKLMLPGAKKTKTGYATGAEVLEKLSADYPVVKKILEYRALTKLKGTYVDGIIPLVDEKGLVHCHFRQNIAATGRLSCTEPNLQNIPVRDERGRSLRKLFTADSPDYILIGADYSQIELRVMAHMSGDSGLLEAFASGEDIHKSTASKVFNVPLDEVTKEMRSNAKAVNFGVIYGMSSFGLADELTISRKQAEKYINEYFERFKDVKAFLDRQLADAKTNGFVRTLYGRKRPIPEINASAYVVRQLGERLAMNSPVQGTAADIIKLAMIKTEKALREQCPEAKMILQIHDELIVHSPAEFKDKVEKILCDSMESAAELAVKLAVSPESGFSWYDLK